MREVKDSFAQQSSFGQKEGDQETADPTVAAEKGVDRLELGVREADLDQRRECPGPAQELLERAQ